MPTALRVMGAVIRGEDVHAAAKPPKPSSDPDAIPVSRSRPRRPGATCPTFRAAQPGAVDWRSAPSTTASSVTRRRRTRSPWSATRMPARCSPPSRPTPRPRTSGCSSHPRTAARSPTWSRSCRRSGRSTPSARPGVRTSSRGWRRSTTSTRSTSSDSPRRATGSWTPTVISTSPRMSARPGRPRSTGRSPRSTRSPGAIVLLRDVPWADGDVPACLSRHPDDARACSFDLEDGIRDGHLAAVEDEIATRRSGVVTADISAGVCSSSPCQVVTPEGRGRVPRQAPPDRHLQQVHGQEDRPDPHQGTHGHALTALRWALRRLESTLQGFQRSGSFHVREPGSGGLHQSRRRELGDLGLERARTVLPATMSPPRVLAAPDACELRRSSGPA